MLLNHLDARSRLFDNPTFDYSVGWSNEQYLTNYECVSRQVRAIAGKLVVKPEQCCRAEPETAVAVNPASRPGAARAAGDRGRLNGLYEAGLLR